MNDAKRRRRLIWALVALVVILASCNVFMLVQSGYARRIGGQIWQAVTRADGVRVLASQLGVGSTREETALRFAKQGAELLEAGESAQALSAFRRAAELAPDKAAAYIGMASAHEALGEQDQAIEQLEHAVEAEPDNAEAQRHLGRLRCFTGDFESCVARLQRSIELEPDNLWGHFFLAVAYQGDAESGYGKAEAAYREVLRLDPDFGRAYLGLGYLYQMRPGQEALALEQFKRALDLAVEAGDEALAAQARTELADLYFAADSFTQCINEMRRVLEQDADNAEALRRIGLCYALRGGTGDLARAIDALDRALAEEFADMDLYYLYLGEYLAEEGDPSGAVAAWEQFLRFSSDEDMKEKIRERVRELEE